MNMQAMMAQAQKMQRELAKAKAELAKAEFTSSKGGGAVKVTFLGNRSIDLLEIDEDAFEKDNKEMVEEMLLLAIQECLSQIDQAEEELNEKITGRVGGLGL